MPPHEKTGCRLVSPGVAPEKDSKRPEWEVSRVTYELDGNILKSLCANLLWKWIAEKKDKNRSNVVTLQKSRMGSLMRAASSEMEYS
jgi:hypothetical protein